jgi:hypothetical protein
VLSLLLELITSRVGRAKIRRQLSRAVAPEHGERRILVELERDPFFGRDYARDPSDAVSS